MCQPTTASTNPEATRAPTSSATRCGGPEPSTATSRSSRASTPPFVFTSSAASCPHSSHDGPKIPAEPCRGTTSATSSVGSALGNSRGSSAPSITGHSLYRREYLADLVLSHRCSMDEGKARPLPPDSIMQRLAQLLSQAERSVTRQLGRLLQEEDCTV